MKFNLSRPGLYYLLNTPEVQAELNKLNITDQALFEQKVDTDAIARMMARKISDEIQRFLADKLEKAENVKPKDRPENWIYEAVKTLPECPIIKSFTEQAIPVDDLPTKQILTEIKLLPDAKATDRPTTELTESELIVPNGRSPQLGNEIAQELKSCEHADWLVSFIKLKAIRSFYPQLLQYCGAGNPDGSPRLRIATTTYMGATDAEALRLLFALPNTEVKICFNTSQTRLHAKAYIFHRKTQFGSAYIGSANLSTPALSSGLEWTIKVAQQEIPHLWERSIVEFDACWNDPNFELCTKDDLQRITSALQRSKVVTKKIQKDVDTADRTYFTMYPHSYQRKMLEELSVERQQKKSRHLIASATGTGKTIVAAFDYAEMAKALGRSPRLLFLAHRTDIIEQAREKYRAVLQSPLFGALISENDAFDSATAGQIFCTIQSWESHISNALAPDFFDLIVMDECHHASAKSYQKVIDFYTSAIDQGKTDLLGLSATPFRADGCDIRQYFGGDFTHELSLAEAIEHGHVVPFTYFGIDDDVDFTSVTWGSGEGAQIEDILHNNGKHFENVHKAILDHVANFSQLRAIGFCAGLKHARAACDYFNSKGIKSIVLSGESSGDERKKAIDEISQITPAINIIFTADLFNEGVDIPCVNTALMMRPTNSPLIFLQQLGRGLRHAPPQYDKTDLLVLDFVGNHNEKYKGFDRFRLLSTRKDIPTSTQIKQGMPFVPAGCAISLTEQARKKVIDNIKNQLAVLRGQTLTRYLVNVIRDANQHLPLSQLMESVSISSPAPIYRYTLPSALESSALGIAGPEDKIGTKLNAFAQMDSPWMLNAWMKILTKQTSDLSPEDIKMAQFFLVSSFEERVNLDTVDTVWNQVITSQIGLVRDIVEFLEWRIHKTTPIATKTFDQTGKYLELHRSYNSKQLSAVLGSTGATIQGGVYYNKSKEVDAFFITRLKNEKDFSPTTMYKDHAKSELIFHWESPNRTRLDSRDGKRYTTNDSCKMLFIRQTTKATYDITGEYPLGKKITSNYIFLGPVKKVLNYEGECPIGIDYELEYPLPADVYDYARGA